MFTLDSIKEDPQKYASVQKISDIIKFLKKANEYYYNSEEVPDYDITKRDYFGEKMPYPAPPSAVASVAPPSAVASVTPPAPPAPEGWTTKLSKSKNKWYFLNLTTGATQWHRPDHASIGGKRKTKKINATKKAKKSKRNATKKAKKSKRNKTKTKKGSKKV